MSDKVHGRSTGLRLTADPHPPPPGTGAGGLTGPGRTKPLQIAIGHGAFQKHPQIAIGLLSSAQGADVERRILFAFPPLF